MMTIASALFVTVAGLMFRPPAVPLVSVDPHFSLWSAANRLYDAETTFWTGKEQPLSIILTADGVEYRLCGRARGRDLRTLAQMSVDVGATMTSYRFAGEDGLCAEVVFLTPRLTDDLDVFSRPVTYLTVRVTGARAWSVQVEMSDAFATDDDAARMVRTAYALDGIAAVKVGRLEQRPFSSRGDRKRPDWGFAHLVGPIAAPDERCFLLAYDNAGSVRFFGASCADWWRREGKPFEDMLREAVRDYPALAEKCRRFDREFSDDMMRVGGADYADIAKLAWRQSFAACRFVAGPGREPMLFSNENGSGGMIGTTDVFYPQLPHLLMTSLTLAKASLAPTCIYAASTNWPYAYAPHDLGLFPVAEGQYYGMKAGQAVGGADDTFRMPVEECGNMLLCLAAVTKAEGNAEFVSRWWGEVSKWAAYLERFGFDPGNQLCTDDFAGHLAHNANLSVKSILALAAYGQMAGVRGDGTTAARYRALAEGLVPRWLEAAKGGAHGGSRIAFDQPDTWSLKYNLVWDRLLGLDLFPPSVAEAELRAYRSVEREYGVPLDCRKTYTKADWLIWCGALTGRREDLAFFARGVRKFLDETSDRIPFSDWYFADSGLYRGFIARSVVGGVFLPVLQDRDLVAKYRRDAPLQPTVDISEYEHVIHPGNDDGTGFWNVNADWFMYAPAFGFKRVEGAAAYLFKVTDRYGHEHRFDATRPTESLAGVWRELPTGDVHVRCEGVGSGGEFVGLAGERMFWKAEGFREGTYPPAKRGYRAAARGVYDYVFSKKGTRILLETGKVDLSDPIASYASKYCAGLIRAMVSYAEIEPARREAALRVATRAADYLIGLSEPEGAPLAWFPPTYAGPGENDTGVRNAGKIMLVYPASVASAFVSLSKATGDRRFLDQAERIAATYLRLQGEDGTWYLKMNAADGTPDGSNRLMPIASTIPMFETLFKATGKELYRKAADRAFSRFDATRMADWNWEGQFEDVPPSEAYRNLTKHDACSAAIYFGDRFPGDRRRQARMRELLRFAEDQFVCWVPPHDGCAFKSRTDWQASRTYDSWQTPCVLEQYECYWPIDSSAAKLIRTYLALYRAEGNSVDLAKAKALGDTMTRVQREDGSIPTWWFNPRCTGNDWVNCMIGSASALMELAEVCEQDKKEDLTGANPAKCLKNKGL